MRLPETVTGESRSETSRTHHDGDDREWTYRRQDRYCLAARQEKVREKRQKLRRVPKQ